MLHSVENSKALTPFEHPDAKFVQDLTHILERYLKKPRAPALLKLFAEMAKIIQRMLCRNTSARLRFSNIPWEEFILINEIVNQQDELSKNLLEIMNESEFRKELNKELALLQQSLKECQSELKNPPRSEEIDILW